jgi:hypothetical protein
MQGLTCSSSLGHLGSLAGCRSEEEKFKSVFIGGNVRVTAKSFEYTRGTGNLNQQDNFTGDN